MKITIIGTGFVGVVSSAVYASFGHHVVGLDVDQNKINKLKQSIVPFFEPNLENLLKDQQQKGHLSFTTSYKKAITGSEIIIIAVGTPSAADGQADLKYVLASCESLAPYLEKNCIVTVKSTVPPGTLDKCKAVIDQKTKTKYHLASLPEFLREGSAVHDTLNPDRIIIGAGDAFTFKKLEKLHKPLKSSILKMKPESAQMAKYTANSYLATRITFINQIANLCEKNGANINEVISGIGVDQRIGSHYWYPGFGYGGSCFPKDVKELAAYSRAIGETDNLMITITELNESRIPKLLNNYAQQINGFKNKKVAVLGLSFKPNTDDMREAPSTRVIPWLANNDAQISVYDPMARWESYPESKQIVIKQEDSIETACSQADVIIALIEWPQIISFDFSTIKLDKKQWFIDARNQFDSKNIKKSGYEYIGVGKN